MPPEKKKLSAEQELCVKAAEEGHNFLIYGEAGTGKSTVIIELCRKFNENGKTFQVVCSTGIACEVFNDDLPRNHKPVTINSFLGIGTAQGPFNEVVRKACRNERVCKKIREVGAIVFDECSMGSARLLELFHSITAAVRENDRPFGGLQVVAVGDFLQLKPVRDNFDDGAMMYHSKLFPKLFPHTIELTVIHRLDEGEEHFKGVLRELRQGMCSKSSAEFIKSRLNSAIDESEGAVHLYFTNAATEAHNAECLYRMQGERYSYVAKDVGDVVGLKCPALKNAFFKEGAPVICLFNINDALHNGTRGRFVRKEGENAVIEVNGGEFLLKPSTWSNVNKEGKQVGSRTQIPLRLYWASTVHKAQGLQLQKAVVHSSPEFTGGLLYTAFSRVKKAKDLQVKNFSPFHVSDRSGEIAEINSHLQHCLFGRGCVCHNPIVLDVMDNIPLPELDDETLSTIVEELFDVTVDVDDENGQLLATLEDVLEGMEEKDSQLSKPPADFDYPAFLSSFKAVDGNDLCEFDEYVKNEIQVVDRAISLLPKFTILIKIIWLKVYDLLEKFIKENVAETRFSVAAIKGVFHQIWDINRQSEFKRWLQKAFESLESDGEKSPLTEVEMSFGTQLAYGVFLNVLNVIANEVRSQCINQCTRFQVSAMDSQGKGKVRFVFAWAVSRILKQSRTYVHAHMYSESQIVQKKVKKERQKIEILENTVIIPYDILCTSTNYPETLDVTESRQFRTHGLLHVTDKVYELSLEFEQARVTTLNTSMLQIHGENLIQEAKECLKSDQSLLSKWKGIISEEFQVEVFTYVLILQHCWPAFLFSHHNITWRRIIEENCIFYSYNLQCSIQCMYN